MCCGKESSGKKKYDGIGLPGASISRLDYEKRFDALHIKSVDVAMIGGNVLAVGKPDCTDITLKMQWNKKRPAHLPCAFVQDGTLKIRARGLGAFYRQTNPFVLEITLPQDLALKIKMFAGVIFIDGLHGPVDAQLKCGEIKARIQSPIARLAVRWAGALEVEGSAKKIEATVGVGSIVVMYDMIAAHDALAARVAVTGDIVVRMPKQDVPLVYRKCSNGFIENSFGAALQAHVPLGDIKFLG